MTDFDEGDIAAMRQQGDLRAFMRQQIAEGAARRDAKPKAAPPSPPGHVPGAWPAGTQPPSPPDPQPPEAWAAAVAEYDAWLLAGSPPCQAVCECPACRQLSPRTTTELKEQR